MAWMLGAELLRQMRELADTLAASAEWLTEIVTTTADLNAAEAEVKAMRLRPSSGSPLPSRCASTMTRPRGRGWGAQA
jgi:hypothetical protein